MTIIQLKKIDAGELKGIIPAKDYAEITPASTNGVFFTTGSTSPEYPFAATPFPLGKDKDDFVGLESAIRKCKRVGLFRENE